MKWLHSKRILASCMLALLATPLIANEKGNQISEKRRSDFAKCIPDYYKVQYAGSMGLMSLGTGWAYGKRNQWETELFFGFIPRYHEVEAHGTFTMKQNYIPWEINILKQREEQIQFAPLSVSLYINKIFGEDFWAKLPNKYPGKYYALATNLRINISVGQRFTYSLNEKYWLKDIAFFYEFGTNDLYLYSAFKNKTIGIKEIVNASLGVKIGLY